MNSDRQNVCRVLRGLTSADAVEWLIQNFNSEKGNSGEAYVVIPRRSWEKKDQIKLANFYLGNLPHRSDLGYRAFLKFMGLPNFISVITSHLPDDPEQRALVDYYLRPILEAHPSKERHKDLVEEFCKLLS